METSSEQTSFPPQKNRQWAIFEVSIDLSSLPAVISQLRRIDPEVRIRIYGDRLQLLKSDFREGCLGYLFIHSKLPYHKFGCFAGNVMMDGHNPTTVFESEIEKTSFTVDDIKKTSLLNRQVIIVSGDYRKLRGTVTSEYDGPDGRDVDIKISVMTFTRIINVSKDSVRLQS